MSGECHGTGNVDAPSIAGTRVAAPAVFRGARDDGGMRADGVHSIVRPIDRAHGGVDRLSRRQHQAQKGQQHVAGTRDAIIDAKTALRRHESRWTDPRDAGRNRRMRTSGNRGKPLDRVVACRSRGREGGGGEEGGRERKKEGKERRRDSRADRGQAD